MSRMKLIHGISKVRRAKLQSSIDQTIADDIELMAQWSNNETQYVINELLRFAIAQEEDFSNTRRVPQPTLCALPVARNLRSSPSSPYPNLP